MASRTRPKLASRTKPKIITRARPPSAADRERIDVADRGALRSWLHENHSSSPGVWLVLLKKSAGGRLTWSDVVEEALCFGWVDSLPRKLDAERSMLLLTPRRPASKWSAKNKAHVADLERRGLMREPGRAAVELAKQNGTWTALDAVSALQVPADLAAALEARRGARQHWDAFPPSTRRGILEWIANAKRAATRRTRVEQTAELAARNIRANQWKPP